MKHDSLKSHTDGRPGIAGSSIGRRSTSLKGPDGINNTFSTRKMPQSEDCGCGKNNSAQNAQFNPLPPPGYYNSYPATTAQEQQNYPPMK